MVDAVLEGTPGAFERLVRHHQRTCWGIVNRMVRDPEDTRELCQEAFLRVHRYLPQFRHESALRTWIGRIAFSVAARHLKRTRILLVEPEHDTERSALIEQVPDEFDLEAACADAALVSDMRAEIEGLPPLQRTILAMYYMEELSVGEIAVVCNLPEGTIKSHLFRSRAVLRERLKVLWGE